MQTIHCVRASLYTKVGNMDRPEILLEEAQRALERSNYHL